MGGQSPRLLSAEEHVLDRAFGEPRRRSDTASDSAAVCPHAPTPAVMLGIDPSMVGATRHHEPDASDRVNLPLPLQPPASAGRLWLLNGTDGPARRLRWLGHRGAIRPSDRYRTRCGGTGRWPSRLLRAVRRLISTVALQAVIAACRWRRHGLDLTAWLTSEATQDPGKLEICPVQTTAARPDRARCDRPNQRSWWPSGPDHRVSVDTDRRVATLDHQSRNRAPNALICLLCR
jgi:hypothetical protein